MDNSKKTLHTGLKEHRVKLHTAVLIMYCLVAAGAFGIEEMIPASGPGLTIVMLIVLPFIWAAPQALVSAELGSAITGAGGFYSWVKRGLGEFWGFTACWCRTLSCYVDNTLYIVLAAGYVGMLIPMTDLQSFILKAVIIGIFTFINLMGIKEVGAASTVFSVLIFIAFTAVTIVGFANWNQNPMEPFLVPGEGTLACIGASLAIGMWMYSGYTSMSTLSGEIEDKSVIPRGLLIVMPIIALSYILPTVAGLASVGNWEQWTTSGGISFGSVLALAGAWGLPAFTIVAVFSNMAIFNTQIISVSRGFYAMADDYLAPRSLVKTSKNRCIPYVGVLSLSICALVLCTFDFSILVTIDVMLLMVDYVLVFISGARLRKTEPDMPRPFKIPLSDNGMIALVAPGVLVAFIALYLNGADYFLGGMVGLISAPVLYTVWKRAYGGLVKVDPENFPINPRTKLGLGDLHRMALVFGFFAVNGLIGAFLFFPWYEGSWAAEYYAETYGTTFEFILSSIKIVSVIYAITAIALKIAGNRIDTQKSGIKAT